MKVKVAFSQIIQPKLVQYLLEKYGNSYDTVETVKNSWRNTYPASDEIIDEIFVQIKTIEKLYLEPREYKRETYQAGLTEVIADYLSKYMKRCDTYKNLTRKEITEMIKPKIDLSENKHKEARFIVKQSTPKYIYIKDLSETEKNITTDTQTVLWHIYKHNALKDRRLFYKDTLDKYNEILHENGILKGIEFDKTPRSLFNTA
jgi:HEPN domain-containing protein